MYSFSHIRARHPMLTKAWHQQEVWLQIMMCQKGALLYRMKANPSGGAAEKSVLTVCAQSKINRKK